jgi:hypothetical protein
MRLWASMVVGACSGVASLAACSNTGGIDHTTDGGALPDAACGASGATVLASAQSSPSAVAVDATSIYWATPDAIMKVSLSGGLR